MATAVSTIANGGTYTQPRIVKEIIDNKTGQIKQIETIKKEKVISEDTSKKILSMMESVVSEGTGKNAQVKGYSIGGKTGTSEDGVNTNKYVASFVGVTPVNNPKLVVLVVLYNPTGEGGHGGGGVAAPVASKVLTEALPYLEVNQDKLENEDIKMNVEVPNIVGLTYKEAKKVLQEAGLQIVIRNETNESEPSDEFIISNQVPSGGVQILEGGNVIVD
ncbi:MAG: PASTA domain-containing protein [Clostridia bacterium]|nr:PASTA domain-containing protein [Clostridia bacterium]